MFNARVVCARLGSEAETENVSVVRAVTDQERAVRKVAQTLFSVVETQRSPVPTALQQHTGTSITVIITGRELSHSTLGRTREC